MVRSVDELKRNVFPGESGGDYDALFGFSNRAGGAFEGVRPTQMTINQVLAFTDPSGPYAQWVKSQVGRVATPVGGFQVVGSTLRDTVNRMGLTGNELFDPAMQDRIGMEIYRAQGPGAWEGWGKGGGNVTMSTSGGQPMGLLDFAMQPEQPQTFRDRLRAPETRDAMLTWLNSMRLNPDPNIATLVDRRAQRREQASSANRTAAWLEANGRPDLAAAVMSGVIDGASAFTVMNQKPEEKGQVVSDAQLRELYPGAQIEPGLYNLKSDGTITKVGGGGTSVTVDNVGAPQAGYQYVRDDAGRVVRMEPIPGGPAAAEAEKAATGAAANAESQTITADIVLDEIKAVKGKVGDGGLPTTGFFGGLLSNIGGTDAGDISASLDTIKGNIAFDKLQAMRAASPTGGALGSVTENELRLLQSTLGSLEQSQSSEQFLRNLTRLEAIYGEIMKKARAYPNAAEFGFASSGAASGGVTLSPEAQRYLEGN